MTLLAITAQHNGYHRLNITHQRTLTIIPAKGWQIQDALLPVKLLETHTAHEIVLHWLLPDLPWQFDDNQLTFQTIIGQATLQLSAKSGEEQLPLSIQIIRAGEVLYGPPADLPTHGWISPTYASKEPALSIRAVLKSALPALLTSQWEFSPIKAQH